MQTTSLINDTIFQLVIYRSGTTLEFSGLVGRFPGDKYYNTTVDREYVWNGTVWRINSLPIVLPIKCDNLSPTDAATYFFGNIGAAADSDYDHFKSYIPYASTIKTVTLEYKTTGTLGTTEDVTIAIRINDTTDYYLAVSGAASVIKFDSADVQSITYDLEAGVGVAVAKNDIWAMKIICPTWATNPTNVYFSGRLILV